MRDDVRCGRPSASRLTLSRECRCVGIISWLFERSQVNWIWERLVFGKLSLKIQACGMSLQKWCHDCGMMIRRSAVWKWVRTSLSPFKLNQACFVTFLSVTWKPSARTDSGNLRHCPGRKNQHKVRVMLITLFDTRGIVHSEFLPEGQMVNQQVYKKILLQCMLCSVCEKRKELLQDKFWLLYHDNAPTHNALSICQYPDDRNIVIAIT